MWFKLCGIWLGNDSWGLQVRLQSNPALLIVRLPAGVTAVPKLYCIFLHVELYNIRQETPAVVPHGMCTLARETDSSSVHLRQPSKCFIYAQTHK